MIVTVDGPSGTGKSTLAKALAKKIGFSYFDTGALYRSFAWYILEKHIDPADEDAVIDALDHFSIEIKEQDTEKSYIVNGDDCTKEIRTEKVSIAASQVAAYLKVRKSFVHIQRKYAENKNAVFEGRDMGTVVFPHAHLKIFLTARPEVRADRRYRQLGSSENEKLAIQEKMKARDAMDAQRKHSPLKKAKDAILIDTSDMSFEEVLKKSVELYNKSRKKKKIFQPMRLFYKFILSITKGFFRLFYSPKVYGVENFPLGKAILASNHLSFLDPPVVAISSPEEIHFLAKKSLFTIPFLGWLIRMLNSHPVGKSAEDVAVLKKVTKLLSQDRKLLLFPEGSRSKDFSLQPLLPGLGFIAYKTKAPIVPIYIQGTGRIWGRGRKFPKLRGKIDCLFGPTINIEKFSHLDKKEAMVAIVDATENALKNLESKARKLQR